MRVKSYLLQEAEAVSRAAKVAWCEAQGLRVVNLQHDGILVSGLPEGLDPHETAELMSTAAASRAGYEVIVKAECMAVVVD